VTERQWLKYSSLAQEIVAEVGQPGQVPARCLEHTFRHFDYRLSRSKRVPPGVLAYTDYGRKRVVVADDFGKRLEFPGSARAVYHATLAHELGHVVLHRQQPGGLSPARNRRWEREANHFALVFLVPYHDLVSRTQVQRLMSGELVRQGALWKEVLELAEQYLVSGAFMVRALEEYEIVDFDEHRRWIYPNLNWATARRVLPAAA
jgi:hypothetical protein